MSAENESLLFRKTDFSPLSFQHYDEAFTRDGIPREQWVPLLTHFNRQDEVKLAGVDERARRMRHDDGATINPFDEVSEPSTSWSLDMIPLPISAQEWQVLERGVKQRAKLLEKILADVYSHQELLEQGKIPDELLFNNPNFLSPCHNIRPSGGRYLTFYAVDIYRDLEGNFRVWRDYGSNPIGVGYSLENRIVMSRLFPNLYHKTQIRRLAPFFQSFHRALLRRAHLSKNEEGIVFFTPGPDNPYYFEHALLSRYLGYPLVEGQDLTVRDGRIFQKKLAGLEPVQAIFRNIPDNACDPFVLRRETVEGVSGLIQVCREENLDISNPIGAGFIDTPLLRLFLPDLCPFLMGENLLLENHPILWCNSTEGMKHSLKPAPGSFILHAMQPEKYFSLQREIPCNLQASPNSFLYVAPFSPSQVPGWNETGADSTRVMMRLFACATEDGFSVMPGGLAIAANSPETLFSNRPEMQRSKDIWVLSNEPVVPITLLEGFDDIPEFKRGSDLPSRVADNMLWLGRYLERAESLIRLLRPAYHFLLGEDRPEDIPEFSFLMQLLQIRNIISLIDTTSAYNTLPSQLHAALFAKKEQESVAMLLKKIREIARNVRDRLSIDSFRLINRLENFTELPQQDPLELLDHTLFTLNGFSGMAMETMTREVGWRFLDMGRRLERAMNQSSLVSTSLTLFDKNDNRASQLQVLLEISHSIMTYRSRYRSSFQLAPVLDLLVLDETNPKSLGFQLKQIEKNVRFLPRSGNIKFSSQEEKLALDMLTSVRLLDLKDITLDKAREDNSLLDFFSRIDGLLMRFSEQITAHYLSRIPSTPHYSGPRIQH